MKIFTSIWMVVVFAVVLVGIRVDNSDTVKILRYKTWDHFQYVYPRQEVSDAVVVINITESDIKKYGQWLDRTVLLITSRLYRCRPGWTSSKLPAHVRPGRKLYKWK